MKVGMKDFRAYILLRNSSLGSEDKKRLIVESQGSLEYRDVVTNLKLLGSRFFHEVHAGKQQNPRTKTYDTNTVCMDDEPTMLTTQTYSGDEEFGFVGDYMDDHMVEQWADEGDPDAVVCMQFEEGLMETLQNDPEMASCLNAYTEAEARKRLADKTKGRGFWTPVKKRFWERPQRKGRSFRSSIPKASCSANPREQLPPMRCKGALEGALEGRMPSSPSRKCQPDRKLIQGKWCVHRHRHP